MEVTNDKISKNVIPQGRRPDMIALTRLNGQQFVLNAEKIRYIESTPDTVVCCDTGEKMMVKETLSEVMRKAIEYSRIVRRSLAE
jgi:flagellar protein FlbD